MVDGVEKRHSAARRSASAGVCPRTMTHQCCCPVPALPVPPITIRAPSTMTYDQEHADALALLGMSSIFPTLPTSARALCVNRSTPMSWRCWRRWTPARPTRR